MRYLFDKGKYKLYEVDDEDREMTGVTGNHYCRNTVLLFDKSSGEFHIGSEVAWAETEEEALMIADELTQGRRRVSFAVQASAAAAAAVARDQRDSERGKKKRAAASTGKSKLRVKIGDDDNTGANYEKSKIRKGLTANARRDARNGDARRLRAEGEGE